MIYFIGPERPLSTIPTATMEECVTYCTEQALLGLDTETTGLDVTDNKIIMVQIGTAAKQFVIDTRFVSIEPLRGILEGKRSLKILHNAKFDYQFFRNMGIVLERVWDTMLMDQVIHCGDEKIRYGLDKVVLRYLKITLKKDVRGQFIGLSGAPYTDAQVVYGAKDVEYLEQIYDHQVPIINRIQLKSTVGLENAVVLAFADIEYNGLDLDIEKWKELTVNFEHDMHELEKGLDEAIFADKRFASLIPEYVQTELFETEIRRLHIKWSSPKQVLEVMQKIVPNLADVNGKNLYLHRKKHPIISVYIKYKEQAKIVSSYGEAFLQNLKSDGRIHTSFRQILSTGRVSSSHPNMQQIPGDNAFRNCFIAPEGWKFVSSDYSSQELNVIAYGSKDPVWLKALKDEQDLHSVCAELVYGDVWKKAALPDCAFYRMDINYVLEGPVHMKEKCNCPEHKKLRTNVKTVNFGLAYGMGPQKLADTIEVSMADAKKLIEEYFKVFPSIGDFLDKLGKFGVRYGFAKTYPPFNRRRKFPQWHQYLGQSPSDSGTISTIERASKNTPIQGTSADMTKLALVYVRRKIKKSYGNNKVRLVMTIHDQIDTICREDVAEQWKEDLTRCMQVAADAIISNELLKAETEVTDAWSK